MIEPTPAQLGILLHALGLSAGQAVPYRRHFVTGPGSTDHADCLALVAAGHMERHPGTALTGGDDLFLVTGTGCEVASRHRPRPPALSRSARRYAAFLRADSGLPFGAWLRRHSTPTEAPR